MTHTLDLAIPFHTRIECLLNGRRTRCRLRDDVVCAKGKPVAFSTPLSVVAKHHKAIVAANELLCRLKAQGYRNLSFRVEHEEVGGEG